ncbi:MAG: chalcone isomerase family protein [Pseudomonas sp.]|uniref:chalcone isomerase family protein n=1 Tax=Pseudomonas TaxID=286 RepID=UPI0003C0B5D0|nr:chalcone isomerase family protein [Pseudomonas sp. VLB120]AGZ35637.1 hypothetical protein PVLB_14265 [Pseudomonas sp. VLB120]
MTHAARWTCLWFLLICLQAAAADWRTALPTAQRLGSGEFTWFGLRVYSARLWTNGPVQDWRQPFALELLYHRPISRETLVQASMDEIRRLNTGAVTPEQFAAWAELIQTAFVDVRPGMRITGLYLPGEGCRFYVDGTLHREIADPAFARAFFAIWLDPRARDPRLRLRLLGQVSDDEGA